MFIIIFTTLGPHWNSEVYVNSILRRADEGGREENVEHFWTWANQTSRRRITRFSSKSKQENLPSQHLIQILTCCEMWLKKTMYSRHQRFISWKEITILVGKYGTHGEDLRDATISQQLRHFAVVWSQIPGKGRTEPCSIHPLQPPINPPHTLGPRAKEMDWFYTRQYWHGSHIVHMVHTWYG